MLPASEAPSGPYFPADGVVCTPRSRVVLVARLPRLLPGRSHRPGWRSARPNPPGRRIQPRPERYGDSKPSTRSHLRPAWGGQSMRHPERPLGCRPASTRPPVTCHDLYGLRLGRPRCKWCANCTSYLRGSGALATARRSLDGECRQIGTIVRSLPSFATRSPCSEGFGQGVHLAVDRPRPSVPYSTRLSFTLLGALALTGALISALWVSGTPGDDRSPSGTSAAAVQRTLTISGSNIGRT